MVVPDLMNPLFPPIYAGADSILGDLGYSVLIASDDDEPGKSRSVIAALLERRVDGLILANAHRDFALRGGREVPVVLVNRSISSAGFPTIVGDNEAGIGLVVRHLAALGHTAIAHVAGPMDLSTGVARLEGFAQAMHANGLEARGELIVEAGAFRTGAGRRACERLLDSGVTFTAIVAGNDLIALGCYDALRARGLGIPGDVSITGYNDLAFVDRVAPPLTTVAVDYREMGAVAARTLLTMLDSEPSPPYEPVRLAPRLIVRESTVSAEARRS
jgi:LacI family transcriptional regulator, galactose operon repressor